MIDVTGLADLPSDTIQYTNDCVTKYNAFDENIMSTTGYEFRFYIKDGSLRWFRSKGVLSRDSEGRPECSPEQACGAKHII